MAQGPANNNSFYRRNNINNIMVISKHNRIVRDIRSRIAIIIININKRMATITTSATMTIMIITTTHVTMT